MASVWFDCVSCLITVTEGSRQHSPVIALLVVSPFHFAVCEKVAHVRDLNELRH